MNKYFVACVWKFSFDIVAGVPQSHKFLPNKILKSDQVHDISCFENRIKYIHKTHTHDEMENNGWNEWSRME